MKSKIFLIAIFILALFLRSFSLNVFPFGFTPDEASFGYDAYSILKTGKDQWGHTLPIVLESFGDFKLPLYSYLTIPSILFFGLNKFSVRLPNALMGSIAVIVSYFLVKELFKLKGLFQKSSINEKTSEYVSLLSALFLTISPWHIMMSRGAFEANLTTLLMPLGMLLFLKSFKNNKYLILSALVFGLNLFSYHSARLVTPIVVVSLIIIFMSNIKKMNRNNLIYSGLVFLIFLITSFYTLTMGGAERAKDINIFNGSLQESSEDRLIAMYQGLSQRSARMFHNKYQVTFRRFVSNYSQYLSANFLFVNGPAEATYGMIPGMGVIYLIELPFLLMFIYEFVKAKNKKLFLVLIVWLLVAPVPAALTQGRGYAGNRAVTMLPALNIISAIGAYSIYKLIIDKFSKRYEKIFITVFVLTLGISFLGFCEKYFYLTPYKNAKAMLFANLEASNWLNENVESDEKVVVSRSLSEPHIYIAFANLWDPSDYQENTKNWERYRNENIKFLDQLGEYSLGNYTFRSIDYNKDQRLFNTFLVGRPDEFSGTFDLVASFISPSGEPFIYISKPIKEVYAATTY